MGDFGPGVLPNATQLPLNTTDESVTTEDINVLVTGFGPFKTNPINPSFLIASSLPQTISLSDPNDTATTTKPAQVRIHTHPIPIRVSYAAVRRAVPSIIDTFRRAHNGAAPDIIIHIGMASTRQHYAVETRAHRDGYNVTDVDGQIGVEEGEIPWNAVNLPEVLRPGQREDSSRKSDGTTSVSTLEPSKRRTCYPCIPDDRLLMNWYAHLASPTDVRLSDEAGRYLCEFIYYTSLAYAVQTGRDRNVVFLHVPGWTDEASVERGRNVVVALVKALVTCWMDGANKDDAT